MPLGGAGVTSVHEYRPMSTLIPTDADVDTVRCRCRHRPMCIARDGQQAAGGHQKIAGGHQQIGGDGCGIYHKRERNAHDGLYALSRCCIMLSCRFLAAYGRSLVSYSRSLAPSCHRGRSGGRLLDYYLLVAGDVDTGLESAERLAGLSHHHSVEVVDGVAAVGDAHGWGDAGGAAYTQ